MAKARKFFEVLTGALGKQESASFANIQKQARAKELNQQSIDATSDAAALKRTQKLGDAETERTRKFEGDIGGSLGKRAARDAFKKTTGKKATTEAQELKKVQIRNSVGTYFADRGIQREQVPKMIADVASKVLADKTAGTPKEFDNVMQVFGPETNAPPAAIMDIIESIFKHLPPDMSLAQKRAFAVGLVSETNALEDVEAAEDKKRKELQGTRVHELKKITTTAEAKGKQDRLTQAAKPEVPKVSKQQEQNFKDLNSAADSWLQQRGKEITDWPGMSYEEKMELFQYLKQQLPGNSAVNSFSPGVKPDENIFWKWTKIAGKASLRFATGQGQKEFIQGKKKLKFREATNPKTGETVRVRVP